MNTPSIPVNCKNKHTGRRPRFYSARRGLEDYIASLWDATAVAPTGSLIDPGNFLSNETVLVWQSGKSSLFLNVSAAIHVIAMVVVRGKGRYMVEQETLWQSTRWRTTTTWLKSVLELMLFSVPVYCLHKKQKEVGLSNPARYMTCR